MAGVLLAVLLIASLAHISHAEQLIYDLPSGGDGEAEALSHQTFVPVRVVVNDPTRLREAVVHMCALNWAAYREDPSRLPMFTDLTQHSGCSNAQNSMATFRTTFGELEDEFLRRGCDTHGHFREKAPGCVPTGLVFHESRCGSTLSANMLAALPYSLVYSESSPPVDVAWAANLSPADRLRALRVVMAAMGRPIAAASYSGVLPLNTRQQGWSPRHLFLKLQSSLTPFMPLFRRAFPETPWVFIHRDGTEVLASLFRNVQQLPAPDAPLDHHVAFTDRGVREAPCMRHRGSASSPAFIRAVTGTAGTEDAILAVPAEDYCAASVAELCATALHQGALARADAFKALKQLQAANDKQQQAAPAGDLPVDLPLADGAGLARAIAAAGITEVTVLDGMLLNASDASGTIAGVGQGVFVEYSRMPGALLPIIRHHFAPRRVRVLYPFPATAAAASAASAAASGGGEGGQGGEGGEGASHLGPIIQPAAPDLDDFPDAAAAAAAVAAAEAASAAAAASGPGNASAAEGSAARASAAAAAHPLGYVLVRDLLSDADVKAVAAAAEKYSKARGRTGAASKPSGSAASAAAGGAEAEAAAPSPSASAPPSVRLRGQPLRGPSLDAEGKFVDDRDSKQSRAWPSMRAAAARYLGPLRAYMLAFNVDDSGLAGSDSGSSGGASGGSAEEQKPEAAGGDGGAAAAKGESAGSGKPKGVEVGAAPPNGRWNSGFGVPFPAYTETATAGDAISVGSGSSSGSSNAGSGNNGGSGAGAATVAGYGGESYALPARLPVSGAPYFPAAAARMLPIGNGYPHHYPLRDILSVWNADVVTVPRSVGAFQSLRVFDAAVQGEREEAERYRRAEVPFVIRNVAAMMPTIASWRDDQHLMSVMTSNPPPGTPGHEAAAEGIAKAAAAAREAALAAAPGGSDSATARHAAAAAAITAAASAPGWTTDPKGVYYMVDVNDDNHFMFYAKGNTRHIKDYVPPTTEKRVSVPDFFHKAHTVAAEVIGEEIAPGALPDGWAAPAAVQARDGLPTGLNDHANNGDAAAWAANGGAPLRGQPPASPALGYTPFDLGTAAAPAATPAPFYPQHATAGGGGAAAPAAAGSGSGSGDGSSSNLPPLFPPQLAVPPKRPQRELWYMRASTNPRSDEESKWIHDAFPIFSRKQGSSFFVVEPSQQRGIHCRFGMPGIIAEAHYDAGRNFVFMTRGRKRYILSAPSVCPHLAMLMDGPSARHSFVDWTSPEGIAALSNGTGIEVVMEAGDALYIPAFWFHYIISLSVNVQCNARSGTPPRDAPAIAACGFDARFTEAEGVHTDTALPPHHIDAVTARLSADFAAEPRDEPASGRRMLWLAAAVTANEFAVAPEPRFGNPAGPAGVAGGDLTPEQQLQRDKEAAAASAAAEAEAVAQAEAERPSFLATAFDSVHTTINRVASAALEMAGAGQAQAQAAGSGSSSSGSSGDAIDKAFGSRQSSGRGKSDAGDASGKAADPQSPPTPGTAAAAIAKHAEMLRLRPLGSTPSDKAALEAAFAGSAAKVKGGAGSSAGSGRNSSTAVLVVEAAIVAILLGVCTMSLCKLRRCMRCAPELCWRWARLSVGLTPRASQAVSSPTSAAGSGSTRLSVELAAAGGAATATSALPAASGLNRRGGAAAHAE